MIILLLILLNNFVRADVNYFGQTFFSEKPLWYWASPLKLTNFRDGLALEADACQESFQFVGYHSQTNRPQKLAAYFSPIDGCDLLAVNLGSDAYYKRENNIVAEYFGVLAGSQDVLTSDFESIINFCPQRKVDGFAVNYRYRSGGCGCWWFDISMPLERVRTTMGLQEEIIKKVSGNPLPKSQGYAENMVQGLANPLMEYQKIDNYWHESFGVADIEIILGRDWNTRECGQMRSFLGVVVPTGDTPEGIYIYEPIVGNNHHWGVTWGAEGIFKYACRSWADVYVVYDIQSKYLFQNQQRRGVDLIGKPWGRYIWVWSSPEAKSPDFGANYLTLCLNVTPRYQMIINTAVLFKGNCWTLELGYNFFARAGEEVCLVEDWQETVGFVDIENFIKDGSIKTASYSLIQASTGTGIGVDVDKNQTPIFVPIKEKDLNLLSAAHPGMQSQMLYFALNYNRPGECRDLLLCIGASNEFNIYNNSPHRWTIWGKVGCSF